VILNSTEGSREGQFPQVVCTAVPTPRKRKENADLCDASPNLYIACPESGMFFAAISAATVCVRHRACSDTEWNDRWNQESKFSDGPFTSHELLDANVTLKFEISDHLIDRAKK